MNQLTDRTVILGAQLSSGSPISGHLAVKERQVLGCLEPSDAKSRQRREERGGREKTEEFRAFEKKGLTSKEPKLDDLSS